MTRPAPTEARRARRSSTVGALVMAGVLALGTAGCGSGSDGGAAGAGGGTGTTAATSRPGTTIDPLRDPTALEHTSRPGTWCDSRPPGQPIPEAQAVVRFDRSQVCPGYVTVVAGTRVTWTNMGTEAHTVTITRSVGSKDVLDQQSIAAGASWSRRFDEIGAYGYLTDAIPSYQGTVEVQTAGGAGTAAGTHTG